MNDFDPLTVARLFERVPWETMLVSIAAALSLCVAEGILTEDESRPLVARLLFETPAALPRVGIPVEELISASAALDEDEIDALYDELQRLADFAHADPGREALYQTRLARLRELQEHEARAMVSFAEGRRQLPLGALDAEMNRVRTLLNAHEDSAT